MMDTKIYVSLSDFRQKIVSKANKFSGKITLSHVEGLDTIPIAIGITQSDTRV